MIYTIFPWAEMPADLTYAEEAEFCRASCLAAPAFAERFTLPEPVPDETTESIFTQSVTDTISGFTFTLQMKYAATSANLIMAKPTVTHNYVTHPTAKFDGTDKMTILSDNNIVAITFNGMAICAIAAAEPVDGGVGTYHLFDFRAATSTGQSAVTIYADRDYSGSIRTRSPSDITAALLNTGGSAKRIIVPFYSNGYGYPGIALVDGGAAVVANGLYTVGSRYFFSAVSGFGVIANQ